MAAAAKRIEIGVRDRAALEAIVGAGTSQARMVTRTRFWPRPISSPTSPSTG